MISRPQPVMLERVGKALGHRLREIAAELAPEIGIVRHRRSRADRRRARAWRRRAAPRAPAASAPARAGGARRSPCRRAGTRPRGRAARASSVCISRCWKPRSSSAAPLGERERQRLQIVVAQHQRAPPRRSSRRAARCAPSSVSRPSRTGRAERDLDVDLDVGGVDAGRIVDRVGVEPDAALRRLDAAALRHAEIGALADHLAAQLGAGDADRRRWRGRRPRRRSPSRART